MGGSRMTFPELKPIPSEWGGHYFSGEDVRVWAKALADRKKRMIHRLLFLIKEKPLDEVTKRKLNGILILLEQEEDELLRVAEL